MAGPRIQPIHDTEHNNRAQFEYRKAYVNVQRYGREIVEFRRNLFGKKAQAPKRDESEKP